MKRVVCIAATLMALCGLSLAAQEKSFDYELQVISRLEGQAAPGDDGMAADLGSTGLYTHFECSFSDVFDALVVLNPYLYGVDIYGNIGRSDDSNLFNFCLGTFHLGNWSLGLGKNMILFCGTEYDPWDWDCFGGLQSSLWNNVAGYQWGGHIAYTTPSEMTTVTAQMVTSPWGEKPFGSRLWCYTAQLSGEYFDGVFSPIYSLTAMESADGQFDWIACLGQFIALGDLSLELNYYNVCGFGDDVVPGDWRAYLPGNTFAASASYPLGDAIDLTVKAVAEGYKLPSSASADYMFSGGANVNWYPLSDSRDLRVHGVVGYNDWYGGAFANLGITWFLNL